MDSGIHLGRVNGVLVSIDLTLIATILIVIHEFGLTMSEGASLLGVVILSLFVQLLSQASAVAMMSETVMSGASESGTLRKSVGKGDSLQQEGTTPASDADQKNLGGHSHGENIRANADQVASGELKSNERIAPPAAKKSSLAAFLPLNCFQRAVLFPFGIHWTPRFSQSTTPGVAERILTKKSTALRFHLAAIVSNGLIAGYTFLRGYQGELPAASLHQLTEQIFWVNFWLTTLALLPCPPFSAGLFIFQAVPEFVNVGVRIVQLTGLFMVIGGAVFSSTLLALIGFVLLINTVRVAVIERAVSRCKETPCQSVMTPISSLPALPAHLPLKDTLSHLETSFVDYGVIVRRDSIIGVFERSQLIELVARGELAETVGQFALPNLRVVSSRSSVKDALTFFSPFDEPLLVVVEGQHIVGLISCSRIIQSLCVRTIVEEEEDPF